MRSPLASVTGAGPVFSSGGNVKDMRRFFDEDIAPAAIRDWYRQGIQRITLSLYNLDVPTIAAVNGPAIGAGIAAIIIGGAIAASKDRYRDRWDRCDDEFRTFRWSDGTYIPYAGGPRVLCPYLRG